MKCRKCGKHVSECKSGYQERVNEKGVPGIFECRPDCETELTEGQALISAITGKLQDDPGSPTRVN